MLKSLNNTLLDDLNRHILDELRKDARLSTVEIGRRIGLSAPAVADRIRKLEDQGYIRGYQTVLDMDKLGLTIRAFINFRTTSMRHAEMIMMVESIKEVAEWYTITGNYCIVLKVVAATSQRLADIIVQLEEYGETNTSLILEKDNGSKNILDLL